MLNRMRVGETGVERMKIVVNIDRGGRDTLHVSAILYAPRRKIRVFSANVDPLSAPRVIAAVVRAAAGSGVPVALGARALACMELCTTGWWRRVIAWWRARGEKPPGLPAALLWAFANGKLDRLLALLGELDQVTRRSIIA